jgi:hypothetical protein
MEPEGSLPCSQKPSEMDAVHTLKHYFSKIPFLLSFYLRLGL